MKISLNFVLLSLSFFLLFGSLFYLFLVLRKEPRFNPGLAENVSPQQSVSRLVEESLTYTGTVMKMEDFSPFSQLDSPPSHRLVDGRGQTLVFLQSQKIDLRLLEGIRASLHGKKLSYLEDGLPLLLVDKVSFR